MITEKQLIKHGFITSVAQDKALFWMHGKVNGVLNNGVFHFPTIGAWEQCKNIGHLKYLYKKYTGEKLVDIYGNSLGLVMGILNK